MTTILLVVLLGLAVFLTFATWAALVVAKRADEWAQRYWDDD